VEVIFFIPEAKFFGPEAKFFSQIVNSLSLEAKSPKPDDIK
jgi:hypothetical protein